MTLDEAIEKYKEITNTDANCPAHCNISCDKCVDESKQLAEWLEELKAIKSNGRYVQGNKAGQKIGYRNAIDDFAERLIEELSHTTLLKDGYYLANIIKPLAEQLKAGGENDKSI